MLNRFSRKFAPCRVDNNTRAFLIPSLSRYLHEPCSAMAQLLDVNRKYLHQVDRLRNHRQRKACLDRHLSSFQLQQQEEWKEVLLHRPGSRILVSYHFGDYIYGNNIVAGSEESGRAQSYLTQLPCTEAFLANMAYCFGEDGFGNRQQLVTDSVSPMSLVMKLRKEKFTLLTFVDLPAGFGERIKVKFLGREAWFPKGPAVISLASGAPLLPVLNFRVGDSNKVQIFPLLEARRHEGESLCQACSRLTQQLVRILEDAFLQYPWQWRFLGSLPAYFDNSSPRVP